MDNADVKPQDLVSNRLHPWPQTAFARWLLGSAPALPARIHAALIQDMDVTPASIMASTVALAILSVVCVHISPNIFFKCIFVSSLSLSLCRLWLTVSLKRGWVRGTPLFTSVYIYATLVWALVQGYMFAGAVTTGNPALETLGGMVSTAIQGLLCARNFQAPRFATAVLLSICVPYATLSFWSPYEWMWVMAAITPPWIYGSVATVRGFRRVSIESHTAKFASQDAAQSDPLTGALNRLGLRQALAQPSLSSGFIYFCLDLDGFKPVNDTFGHSAGDTLLKLVTERLRHTIRAMDSLIRCGGDEFVILIPGLSPGEGELFAARLIDKVSSTPYALDGGVTVKIGVSVGFACYPQDAETPEALGVLADSALYAAKEHGKGIWRRSAA